MMIESALGLALWSVVDWFLSRTNRETGDADTGDADTGDADTGDADTGGASTGGASTGGAGSGTSSNQILRGAKRKASTPSALIRFPVARSLRR